MKRLTFIMIFAAAVLCVCILGANAERRKVPSRQAPMGFSVTNITPKPDDKLTRIAGVLTGQPHTSNRIDCVTLVTGRDSIVANDIDGVDFERYFQWEDEGEIDLEIDFPAPKGRQLPKIEKGSQLVFTTVLGEYKCVVK